MYCQTKIRQPWCIYETVAKKFGGCEKGDGWWIWDKTFLKNCQAVSGKWSATILFDHQVRLTTQLSHFWIIYFLFYNPQKNHLIAGQARCLYLPILELWHLKCLWCNFTFRARLPDANAMLLVLCFCKALFCYCF